MTWQDAVLSVGAVFFIIALVPLVRSRFEKPPLFTSITTGAWLAVFAVVYATKDLPFACATTTATAACWLLVAWQTWTSI